jgi:hypothetical protein
MWQWLARLARRVASGAVSPATGARDAASATGPVWCVVANVREQQTYGEGGRETRRGTKHFAPGAKLHCFPPLWGDGYDNVRVVGHHRGSHRYVTMVVPSRRLERWRAELVYSPAVVKALAGHWDGTAVSRQMAEDLVRWMQARSVGGEAG